MRSPGQGCARMPSPEGRRRLLGAAGAVAVAALGAGCGGESTSGPPPVAATLVGRVTTLDEGSPAGLTASVAWRNTTGASPVAADGSFEVTFPELPQGPGTLIVDDGDPGGGYHPAWVRLPSNPGSPIEIVQIPTRWSIRQGLYAGQELRIRASDAAESLVQVSYWGFGYAHTQEGARQEVIDATRWTGGLTTWPETAFPIPLALDRATSTSPPTAADSVDLWTAISVLEEHLGRDAFEPARFDDLDVTIDGGTATASHAVLVRVDSALALSGRARTRGLPADWLLREEVGDWSDGLVTNIAIVSLDLDGAVVDLRENAAFRRPELLIHEMMHVLGVGHGCEWPSVQTYCASLATDVPSPEDIAHLEVLERSRRRAKDLGTRHGIVAAVFGERIVTLGLSPFPGPGVVYGPDNVSGPGIPGL